MFKTLFFVSMLSFTACANTAPLVDPTTSCFQLEPCVIPNLQLAAVCLVGKTETNTNSKELYRFLSSEVLNYTVANNPRLQKSCQDSTPGTKE